MQPRRPPSPTKKPSPFTPAASPAKSRSRPPSRWRRSGTLSLAYSPGVAVPVRAIAEQPDAVYDYTAKGNLVAVISNGTAILGLGDLGALAVQAGDGRQGRALQALRRCRCDRSRSRHDRRRRIHQLRCAISGPSFGGINLEDIKAPDCFVIEERLRELMDIPVFHDDQHGTAIISTAGVINALHLTGRKIADIKVVVNGAGAAGIACLELLKAMGLPNAQRHSLRHQRRRLSRPHRAA